MSIGRGRHQPDPMDRARSLLIMNLRKAGGEQLKRAVQEGEQYVFVNPTDETVVEALDLAKRRQAETALE